MLARFPRLLCRRVKKLAALIEYCFCLLTGSSPFSLYDSVISEIVLRRHCTKNKESKEHYTCLVELIGCI